MSENKDIPDPGRRRFFKLAGATVAVGAAAYAGWSTIPEGSLPEGMTTADFFKEEIS